MGELLDLLPPGSSTDADDMLIIGGCRVDDLAEEFGTPVLVVAEDALRAVPMSLREASYGLGARRATTAFRVVFPGAISGIDPELALAGDADRAPVFRHAPEPAGEPEAEPGLDEDIEIDEDFLRRVREA